MDPVSGAASIITILTTVVALSGGLLTLIDSITDTPGDIASLFNELQDLRVVLASVELSIKCADGFQGDGQLLSILPVVLRRMEEKLRKLELHIRGFGDSTQGKMTNFKGLEWTLRGKDKARRMRDDISALKWPITACLGSLSLTSAGFIGRSIDEVKLDMRVLNHSFKQATMAFDQQQTRTVLAINDMRQLQEANAKILESKLEDLGAEARENGLNMFISGQLHSLLPPSAVAAHLSLQQ